MCLFCLLRRISGMGCHACTLKRLSQDAGWWCSFGLVQLCQSSSTGYSAPHRKLDCPRVKMRHLPHDIWVGAGAIVTFVSCDCTASGTILWRNFVPIHVVSHLLDEAEKVFNIQCGKVFKGRAHGTRYYFHAPQKHLPPFSIRVATQEAFMKRLFFRTSQ